MMVWSAGCVSDTGLRPFMEHSVGLILVASPQGESRETQLEGVKQTQAEVAPELKHLSSLVSDSAKKKA
jgi:hypothetical protein